MERFEVDRDSIFFLYTLYKSGRINFEPVYQRGRVWSNELRYALIDSIKEEFPIGLVMFNVVPHVDEDNTRIEKFDVVDGQQRIRTIMEYIDGAEWALVEDMPGFEPFKKLSVAKQARFNEYKIPVAKMKEFEAEEITECYSRLQTGKALKVGEKLKSLTTYRAHPYVQDVSKHRVFGLDDRHKVRDAHWALATAFLKAVYQNDLFARQEYTHLAEFMRSSVDARKATRALEQCRRILNYEYKVLEEALREDNDFRRYVQTARTLKWVFAAISSMTSYYALSGREHLVAKGVLSYYRLLSQEGTDEWTAYVNTGRTGRIDTKEVKDCLVHLENQILIATSAEPLDRQRLFNSEQRRFIYRDSGGRCAECGIELSPSNFHADHTKPHSAGGETTVGNGRALCSRCNRLKGNTWKETVAVTTLAAPA